MSEIKFNGDIFFKRAELLTNAIEKDAVLWSQSTSLCFVLGGQEEENIYQKSIAIQQWLLGFELPTTVLAFKGKEILFISGKKKVAMVQEMIDNYDSRGFTIKMIAKPKTDIQPCLDELASFCGGGVVGLLPNEVYQGDFAPAAIKAASSKATSSVDIISPLSNLLAVKDEIEVENHRKASAVSSWSMKYYMGLQRSKLNSPAGVKHEKLAESMDDKISSVTADAVDYPGIDPDDVQSCYTPIIQSGKEFSFKAGHYSDQKKLAKTGTVICSLGSRHASYCSNITRTFIINGSELHKKAYNACVDAQNAAIQAMRPGVPLSEVYSAAKDSLTAKKPEWAAKMAKNCGFMTGISLREKNFVIKEAERRPIMANTVYYIMVAFGPIQTKTGPAAFMLGDTVLVNDEGSSVLTKFNRKDNNIFISLEEEESDEDSDARPAQRKRAPTKPSSSSSVAPKRAKKEESEAQRRERRRREKEEIMAEQKAAMKHQGSSSNGRRTRQRKVQDNTINLVAINTHQAELEESLITDRIAHYQGTGSTEERGLGIQSNGTNVVEKFDASKDLAYRTPKDFPDINARKIHVDAGREAVFIPINGRPTPFRIAALKNVTKNEVAARLVELRFNFHAPPANQASKYLPSHEFPSHHFMRELSIRTSDVQLVDMSIRKIKEIMKRITERAKRKTETPLEVQGALQLTRDPKRIARLTGVFIRPSITAKMSHGTLEAHANGLRFVSQRNEKVEILYTVGGGNPIDPNIKHAFFQPSEEEILVLVHFSLVTPIMLGKKKIDNIQFATEVRDASEAIGAKKGRGYDPDEVELEQRERELRKRLDMNFQAWTRAVEEIADRNEFEIKFDSPYRSLGFQGVAHRATVKIMPTTDALVALSETPFFVNTLNDIEVVSLERVAFGINNFDMVLIPVDHSKPIVQVTCIPTNSLDKVKEWLDSVDLRFYEVKSNISWKAVMAEVRKDEVGFYQDGGWKSLGQDEGSDAEGPGSDSEDTYSEGTDGEESYESDNSFSSGIDESDAEASASSGEEDDDSGEDWSDMEKDAARADRERAFSDDEDRGNKRGRRR